MSAKRYLPTLLLFCLASSSFGQTESEFQSPARPYKLDIAAPVQLAASDESSKTFQSEVLPGMLKLAHQSLSEAKNVKNLNAISLDPSKMILAYDSTVRVYFLSEGAGYKNSLGI
jgi:hypothetical protein